MLSRDRGLGGPGRRIHSRWFAKIASIYLTGKDDGGWQQTIEREPDLANKIAGGRRRPVDCASCNIRFLYEGIDPLRC